MMAEEHGLSIERRQRLALAEQPRVAWHTCKTRRIPAEESEKDEIQIAEKSERLSGSVKFVAFRVALDVANHRGSQPREKGQVKQNQNRNEPAPSAAFLCEPTPHHISHLPIPTPE